MVQCIPGNMIKRLSRFETVYRLSGKNADTKLEACLMLAEAYERKADRSAAINWYKKSLRID